MKKFKERIVSLFTARMKEEKKEKARRRRDRQTSQSETSLGEICKMAHSPFAFGAELALCQRCTGKIAEKDGDDGKHAAGSSSEREQTGGGDSTKVVAARRSGRARIKCTRSCSS